MVDSLSRLQILNQRGHNTGNLQYHQWYEEVIKILPTRPSKVFWSIESSEARAWRAE